MGLFNFLFKRNKKQVISPKKKESRTAIVHRGIGGAVWFEKNFENFAREVYMKNVIAYRAVSTIANAFASPRWNLFKQNSDGESTEIFNNQANLILKRANIFESFNFIRYKMMCYYLISGNAYIERVRPSTGPNSLYPKELYVHRPDHVAYHFNDVSGKFDGFIYKYNGQSTFFGVDQLTGQCDLLHLKMFHPLDPNYGLSVTEPTARDVDTSNAASEWNMRLIQNECRPGLLLMFKGILTADQYDRLSETLLQDFAGPSNSGKSLILESEEGVVDAKSYNISPKEMDWIEANRETARRIALGFGVPPQLIGIPGDNTYSNYQEARLALWEDTVIPLLNFFKEEFNNWIFGGSVQTLPFFYDYDLEDVPALSPRRDALWTRAETANFLTINEKRAMVGLETIIGGDVLLISSAMIPLGEEQEEELPEDDIEEEEEEEEEEIVDDEEEIEE